MTASLPQSALVQTHLFHKIQGTGHPGPACRPALILPGAWGRSEMGRARPLICHMQARQSPVSHRHPRCHASGSAGDRIRLQAFAAQDHRQRPYHSSELRTGQFDRHRWRATSWCSSTSISQARRKSTARPTGKKKPTIEGGLKSNSFLRRAGGDKSSMLHHSMIA